VSAVASTDVPDYSSYFSTGDVIEIGYNIFVMTDGQRRLVPNPDTLDALGIPRSWINNKGLSDLQLQTISRGPDIPDVNRDRAGFDAFKARYFPNTTPIVPSTSTPLARPGGGTDTPSQTLNTPQVLGGITSGNDTPHPGEASDATIPSPMVSIELQALVFELENDDIAGSSAVPTNPEELARFQIRVIATTVDCAKAVIDILLGYFTYGLWLLSPSSANDAASCIHGFFDLFPR
jgi:hypothetical protein